MRTSWLGCAAELKIFYYTHSFGLAELNLFVDLSPFMAGNLHRLGDSISHVCLTLSNQLFASLPNFIKSNTIIATSWLSILRCFNEVR